MTICVTGGTSGIGRAIAERFAPGNTVYINYHRDDVAAKDTAASIERNGGNVHLIKADLSTSAGCRALIDGIRLTTDRLDQLVHCAALATTGPLLEVAPTELERSVAVNALALIHLTREALPLLSKGSSVFFLSSRGSRIVIPNYGPLGTAKAFAEHIVRYLAVELAPKGIRVNAVSPGPIDTPAFRAMFPSNYRERLEASAKANPSGRAVELSDAADLVEMLSRPEFSMLQGQVVAVDGGLSL